MPGDQARAARTLANLTLVIHAIIWAVVILISTRMLRGTEHLQSLRPILAGGAIASIIVGAWLRPLKPTVTPGDPRFPPDSARMTSDPGEDNLPHT